MNIPEWPEIQPLSKITPTSFEALRMCKLRAVLNSSPGFSRYSRMHPKTIIGIVCHDILHRLNTGQYDKFDPDEFCYLLRSEYKQQCNTWFMDSNYTNRLYTYDRPEEWPGYNIQHHRLQAKALKLYKIRRQYFPTEKISDLSNDTQVYVEHELSACKGYLSGTLDRIVHFHGGNALIEDYKTGEIYDDNNQLKPNIRRQMLLYATLCHSALQTEKITLRVVPLHGNVYEEIVDLAEAKLLTDEALQLLNRVNEQIQQISLGYLSPKSLAQPSIESCLSCPFKFRCKTFWSKKHESVSDSGYFDIVGQLTRFAKLGKSLNLVLSSKEFTKSVIIIKVPLTFLDYLSEQIKHSTQIMLLNLKQISENHDSVYMEPTLTTTLWNV